MMGRAITTLAALALAAVLTPAPVWADTVNQMSYDLTTKQTDIMSAGEYDGRLKLRISSDGIVSGTYLDTQGRFSSVTGGLDGKRIWVDLGSASPTSEHLFTGTFEGGKLTASATHGMHSWTLEGTPASH